MSRKSSETTLLHLLIARGGVMKSARVMQFIVLWSTTCEVEERESLTIDEFIQLGGYYSTRTAYRVHKEVLELLPEFTSVNDVACMVRQQKASLADCLGDVPITGLST